MSDVKTKYYQMCEFCGKEYEVSKDGLPTITLPGYLIEYYGSRMPQMVTGVICENCMQKLREKLSEFIRLHEISYAGNNIEWIDK